MSMSASSVMRRQLRKSSECNILLDSEMSIYPFWRARLQLHRHMRALMANPALSFIKKWNAQLNAPHLFHSC